MNEKIHSINFLPSLSYGSKLVIPVSMGRYNISKQKTEEYDFFLDALFTHTALLLRCGVVSCVDIISTAELQYLNWGQELIYKTEKYFLKKHGNILKKQSNILTWNEWIKSKKCFDDAYQTVTNLSSEGMRWYDLMVRTHHSVKMSSNVNASIEYQRTEYAAIIVMSEYDNLIYTGSISLAWAYMYHIFNNLKLPTFTRARVERVDNKNNVILNYDATQTVRLLLSNIEQTLTNSNFPPQEKQKLIDGGLSLFYAYENICAVEPNKIKVDEKV